MSMNWQDLLNQAEAGGSYDAIPEGQYTAYVQDASPKAASSGKQMIACVFEVTSGPHKGRRVWNNFVITRDNPNALAWFFRHMQALGLGKDFFALNPSLEATAAQIKGKHCVIDVTTKVWNNETRNEVKKVSPPAAGSGAPMTASTAQPTPAPTPTPAAEPATPAPSTQPPSLPF